MAPRIVRHAMFAYRDQAGVEQYALRGQVIELDGEQLARAERLDAVAPQDEAAGITGAAPVRAPLGPDEVLAAGAQADDAGSTDQVGDTTATSGAAVEKPAARRSSRSSG